MRYVGIGMVIAAAVALGYYAVEPLSVWPEWMQHGALPAAIAGFFGGIGLIIFLRETMSEEEVRHQVEFSAKLSRGGFGAAIGVAFSVLVWKLWRGEWPQSPIFANSGRFLLLLFLSITIGVICGLVVWPKIWLRLGGVAGLGSAAGDALRKLVGLIKGALWLAFGAMLVLIGFEVLGEVTSGLGRLFGWCVVAISVLAFLKALSEIGRALQGPPRLDNQYVHGDARTATQTETQRAARGKPSPPLDDKDFD